MISVQIPDEERGEVCSRRLNYSEIGTFETFLVNVVNVLAYHALGLIKERVKQPNS